MIQAWIERAQVEDNGSVAFRQGIAYLQSLLASLIPEETSLLPNYPNPFNPETWIPYQLSEPADVTLRIYAVSGSLVRTLALGQMPAGMYQARSRAAYWDGKNDVGETVASGIYFYTLTAGDFTATRKMLIREVKGTTESLCPRLGLCVISAFFSASFRVLLISAGRSQYIPAQHLQKRL